ncbi:hypothetical protein ABZY05_25570 [Streptomyces canus]|uniref:hypothetical protein n=1 Tax=Streptomyces canus TaxID=58343 RepID=UPI00339F23F0
MTNGERRAGRGTPASHLGDHLGLISQFTEQARIGLVQESDTSRLFMAIHAGFLVEAGAGIRWLLEPALIEQAMVAVRRVAPRTTGPEGEVATRLPATLWSAGVVVGIDTEDWIRKTPELPGICLRMAAQLESEPDTDPPD